MSRATPQATYETRPSWGESGALLGFALPAGGQELPEGKGKDLVAAHCNSCHPFYARLGAGYTAKGWRTVMRMMANHGISAIHDIISYSESGTTPNTVVRFDPQTEKFQSWAIPGSGNIVRNTSVTRAGDFVLANSLVNAVTLFKIST